MMWKLQRHGALPKTLVSLMRFLTFCPHTNASWPIRCTGEAISSQHCYDCGAQRPYRLQPTIQRGPWKRRQVRGSYALDLALSSSVRSGPVPPEPLAAS